MKTRCTNRYTKRPALFNYNKIFSFCKHKIHLNVQLTLAVNSDKIEKLFLKKSTLNYMKKGELKCLFLKERLDFLLLFFS